MADITALKNRIRAAIKANDNQEITGPVLQQALLDIVDELNGATETEAGARQNGDSTLSGMINAEKTRAEGAENTLQQNITAEKNRAEGAESVLRGLIDGITENIENGYMYAGIATPSSTPATGKVFYLALTAGTYTNFGNTEVSQGINILKYNGSAWSLDAFISIDENANIGGNGVVKGNGIATELLKLGINTLGWTKNGINYSTGAISPNNDRRLSELVPIINECLIQIEDVETITSAYGIVWYNEDKEFISGIGWQSSLVYDITSNAPSSAKYFRIFVNATEISSDNVFVFTTGSLLYNYMVDELNGATETEAGARQNGDRTLFGMINAETQRAQQVEGGLSQRITQETQRAQEAEQAALNFNFNYLTRFVDCTIELTYNNDTTLTYVLTRGTTRGYIYHQSGYFSVAASKTDTIQLLDGVNILYYDSSDNSIKVTGDGKVVNKQTSVVLEIFYTYRATPAYSCWTSPNVAKTGIPSDSYGFADITKINNFNSRITTLETLPKNISRAVYVFSGSGVQIKNNGDGTLTITNGGSYLWGDNGDSYALTAGQTNITLSVPGHNFIYYNPNSHAFEKATNLNSLPANAIIIDIFYAWSNSNWVSFWTSQCVSHEDFPDGYINSHSSYVSYGEINNLSKQLPRHRLTRLFNCTIALVYNGDTTATCTITRNPVLGYVYHEDGYFSISSTLIEDSLQLIGGVNIVYFDAYQQHTLVTNNVNNLNNDCVILEIFYAYHGSPVYSCWTSPDVTKTGIPNDSKGYVDNRKILSLESNVGGLNTRVTALENTPNSRVFPYSVKIFRRIGCIGDSYTKGYIYPSGGSVTEDENYAWPHFMETITKNVYSNWGVSGSTAKGWMSGAAKLAQVQANGNKCQAYIIGLMINDRSQAAWNQYYTPVGVIGDIGTDNDTYYAWYYKLVQAVITVNPSAPIFCNTCPKYANNDAYNQAVRDIVAYCHNNNQKVYLNDLASDNYSAMFANSAFAADAVNGHYTAIGYEFMAECLKEIISDTINANVAEFQNVHLIPFDNPS